MSLVLLRLMTLAAALSSTNAATLRSDFPENPFKLKHDYKRSFKFPFSKDGQVYHFAVQGDSTVAERFVRLAPSIPGKAGSILSDLTLPYASWMIDVSYLVSGRGFLGGEGLGVWISPNLDLLPKERRGDGLAGNAPSFKGIGIILDTSDASLNRKSPYIYGVQSTGGKSKSDFKDYTSPSNGNILGGCFADYRNPPSNRGYLRILFRDGTLTVFSDMNHHGQGYTRCFEKSGLKVSFDDFRIGLTAAADDFADDHDIYSLDVYQVDPPEKKATRKAAKLTEEEKKRIHHYEEIVNKVQEESNPEAIEQLKGDAVTPRTIQKIMENQFHMIEMLENLEKKSLIVKQSDGTTVDMSNVEIALRDLVTKFHRMEETMSQLKKDITSIEQALHINMDAVHEQIQSTKTEIYAQRSENQQVWQGVLGHLSGTWSWFKYITSVFGVAFVLYVLSTFFRKKEQVKKFI